jgi:hypothetical protein
MEGHDFGRFQERKASRSIAERLQSLPIQNPSNARLSAFCFDSRFRIVHEFRPSLLLFRRLSVCLNAMKQSS